MQLGKRTACLAFVLSDVHGTTVVPENLGTEYALFS